MQAHRSYVLAFGAHEVPLTALQSDLGGDASSYLIPLHDRVKDSHLICANAQKDAPLPYFFFFLPSPHLGTVTRKARPPFSSSSDPPFMQAGW